MLQSIPDPFDSYGPPTTENQIFSILPPLMAATSPGPTSIASTPRLNTSELSISPTRPSWMPTVTQPGVGGYFAETNSAWADMSSLPRTPPTTSPQNSPPNRKSKSPQQKEGGALGVFRRNSHPPSGGTKAESRLRSVLTAIDESHTRSSNGSNGSEKDADSPDTPTNPEMSDGVNHLRLASDKLVQAFGDDDRVGSWKRNLPDSGDESENETSPTTPRHSAVFIPASDDDPQIPTSKGHDREASRTPTAEAIGLPT